MRSSKRRRSSNTPSNNSFNRTRLKAAFHHLFDLEWRKNCFPSQIDCSPRRKNCFLAREHFFLKRKERLLSPWETPVCSEKRLLPPALPKKCTAGCQPADVVAQISISADSRTGWQPVLHFLGKALPSPFGRRAGMRVYGLRSIP